MTKVLVCGGRRFEDFNYLTLTLDKIHGETPISLVIHGDALGADRLAGKWARMRQLPSLSFPAQWDLHGRKAGPIRNQRMLDARPDLIVAFAGGKGSADMVRRAVGAGIELISASEQRIDAAMAEEGKTHG